MKKKGKCGLVNRFFGTKLLRNMPVKNIESWSMSIKSQTKKGLQCLSVCKQAHEYVNARSYRSLAS